MHPAMPPPPGGAAPPPSAAQPPAGPPVPFHPTPGVRFTWQMYPDTPKPAGRSSAASALSGGSASSGGKHKSFSQFHLPPLVVPLACVLTPLHTDPSQPAPPVLPAKDLQHCRGCHGVWNDRCRFDIASRFWACSVCFQRNPLPADFDVSTVHPAATNKVVEYSLGFPAPNTASPVTNAPAYIFIVDLCVPPDELQSLKSTLGACIQRIPQDAVVGFIGIGRSLTLWELGFEALNKSYCFRGTKTFSKPELLQLLGLTQQQQNGGVATPATTSILGRFLVPLSQCEFALTSLIEDLTVDPFLVPSGERPQRATGVALDVATTLLELSGAAGLPGGRIVLLTGGPCTRGPGTIVSVKKNDMIRTYRDFIDGSATLFEPARCFYDGLATRLSDCRACCDIFIACLDQTGLTEMRNLTDATGGVLVCADLFSQLLFSKSFERYVDRIVSAKGSSAVGYGIKIDVVTSPNTAVCGALGLCRDPNVPVGAPPSDGPGGSSATARATGLFASVADALGVSESSANPASKPPPTAAAMNNQNNNVNPQHKRMISANGIGISDTTSWFVSTADPNMTLTFIFDTELADGPQPAAGAQPASYVTGAIRVIQFIVSYTTSAGERRVRVITASQPVAASDNTAVLTPAESFDQSVAAAVIARMAVQGISEHANFWETARRWVDKTLVRFVRKVANYTMGQPGSLRLARVYSLLPTLLFNFRRSEYFMFLNISPDEATFKQHYLMRETVESVLLMMQPTVDTYSMEAPYATPALLDSSSIVPDRVLMLDSFYNVHVVKGHVLYEWEKAQYHLKEDFAHLKRLLEQPVTDAQNILAVRFPYPRYSVTDQYGSEVRHVLTKLNPSVTHNSGVADSRSAAAQRQPGQPAQEVIYTDDASVQRFMETLKTAVVTPEN